MGEGTSGAEERAASRDLNEAIPTAFQLLAPELAKLAEQQPAAWLVSMQASFVEQSWLDDSFTISESPAPHGWSASAWIGPERPRPDGGSSGVGWTVMVEDSEEDTGVQISRSRGPLGGRKLFKATDGPPADLLNSDAALAAFQKHGADEYCRQTGARLAMVQLSAEQDGRAVWGAFYQRLDNRESMVLIIDARTGELLHSEIADRDH